MWLSLRGYIGINTDYVGIMEQKRETTIEGLGFRDIFAQYWRIKRTRKWNIKSKLGYVGVYRVWGFPKVSTVSWTVGGVMQ